MNERLLVELTASLDEAIAIADVLDERFHIGWEVLSPDHLAEIKRLAKSNSDLYVCMIECLQRARECLDALCASESQKDKIETWKQCYDLVADVGVEQARLVIEIYNSIMELSDDEWEMYKQLILSDEAVSEEHANGIIRVMDRARTHRLGVA